MNNIFEGIVAALICYDPKLPKVRIGKSDDGGYVIVDNPKYDLLISCGISNDDSFVEKLTNIGKLAGLNEEKITNCFSDEKLVDKIIQSRSDAEKKYGIQSTPSFIINEKKYSAMSFENFEKH